jgi:uncharacterized protein (TIGR03546 family)
MLLPTPISWIKKTLSILKSDLSPNQIGLAFALGIFAGLPPMGAHVLIPFSLALLLRCSFRSFLISMGVFKLLSLAVAPVTYALGKWLLDTQRGLDVFWRWLFHLPVIAPLGYTRYVLLGSLVVALALAIPAFFLIRFFVQRYRDSLSTWVSGWRLSRWLKSKRGIGLAQKLFAGGPNKYELEPSRKGVFRVIRREMIIGLPVLYGFAYLVAAIVIPFFAGTLAMSSVSLVAGTEVAVEDSSFNLFTGGLTLTDFTIQDPDAPDENLIVIPEVRVDTGLLALISNRVVLNSVIIADAELHVKREADGTLNMDNPSSGWESTAYLEWASQYADRVDWMGLLRQLSKYLADWNPLAAFEDPYAAYGGGRSFPHTRPPLTIQRLEIGRILITLEDETEDNRQGPLPPMTMLEVEVSNLAFPVSLRTEPVRISLRGQWGDDADSGFQLSATFSESDSHTVATIDFALKRLDLSQLARFYATTLPVQIRSGLASISGSIHLDGTASGTLSFLLEDFELSTTTARPLFGLPVATSERVIGGINHYAAEVPLVFGALIEGSADAPVVAWEAPLLEIAREGLMMMGKREFNRTIMELGSRIDGLGGFEDIPLDPSFEGLQQATESAARNLIENAGGGLLQDLPVIGDAIDDEGDREPADGADLSDLLPGLLNKLLDSAEQNEDTEGGASSSD